MIIVLRGHIRKSFQDDNLYNLIKKIYEKNSDLKIYITTFDIIQNSISWRRIEENNEKVSEEMIYNYFRELTQLIKYCMIIDDTKITLIGNLSGKIARTMAPVIGWKNYWYCKYQIIDYLYTSLENKKEPVVNLRFDIFSNSNNFKEVDVISFIENKKKIDFIKNVFIREKQSLGIDNVYMGNIETQNKLISRFYYHLDDILLYNKTIVNQEVLVFTENDIIFKKVT
jgi:hypothetical protein